MSSGWIQLHTNCIFNLLVPSWVVASHLIVIFQSCSWSHHAALDSLQGKTASTHLHLSSSLVVVVVSSFSHIWLFATPRTVARQAPLSLGFLRQEYWSELSFPSPGDLPQPGTEPTSPALAGRFSMDWATWEVSVSFYGVCFNSMGSASTSVFPPSQEDSKRKPSHRTIIISSRGESPVGVKKLPLSYICLIYVSTSK